MAKWGTFRWSDGTKWADANGPMAEFTSVIDRSAYYVSLRVNHTNAAVPGSLSSFILLSASAETGARPQLPNQFEAIIDRNDETQRISVRVNYTAGAETVPFTIDKIHLLASRRAKTQPTS